MKKIISLLTAIFLSAILVGCAVKEKYIVSYDVNGGTPYIDATWAYENDLATKPSLEPVKEGYTFEYWMEKESKTEWKFATQTVTKDITLTAKWEPLNQGEIYFTKYFETTKSDKALELYNSGENTIDLSKYAIQIYTNGSKEVTEKITLTGTLSGKSFFLITNNTLENSELKKSSNLMTEKLSYDGNDVIELVYEGQRVDIIGTVGLSVDFAKDVTLIKKLEYLSGYDSYDPYHYIKYNVESYQYLKTFEGILTNQELIEGPKLTEEVMALPFIDPNNPNVGGGGLMKVESVLSVSDGDTATFVGVDGKNYTMRYYYIDTPEVIGAGFNTGQPWAYQASRFNKLLLKDAEENQKEIYIQSIKGSATRDNYGRYLGLVWVDGRLSNYDIVRAGMSNANIGNNAVDTKDMHYKDIPYSSFLENIDLRSIKNEFGVNGIDPYYDMTAGRLTITNWQDARLDVSKNEYDPEVDK